QFFEGSLSRLRRNREDTSEDNDLMTSMDFGIFQPYQNIAQLQDEIADVSGALRLGVAIEGNSIRFYQACLQNVSTDDVKSELGAIIEEEKKHKDLLNTLLNVLLKDKK
ncbi:MAG: hypothetical protein PHF11_04300, partial [Candidatus Omnitrophica bacterium]|nr:hypothetical protein [Candidatus Omnitrophota bacterium]